MSPKFLVKSISPTPFCMEMKFTYETNSVSFSCVMLGFLFPTPVFPSELLIQAQLLLGRMEICSSDSYRDGWWDSSEDRKLYSFLHQKVTNCTQWRTLPPQWKLTGRKCGQQDESHRSIMTISTLGMNTGSCLVLSQIITPSSSVWSTVGSNGLQGFQTRMFYPH